MPEKSDRKKNIKIIVVLVVLVLITVGLAIIFLTNNTKTGPKSCIDEANAWTGKFTS